jgi:hypothetical protein
MKAEDAIAANRCCSAHNHVWVKDDRPGWRSWVCVACAYSFEVKVTA